MFVNYVHCKIMENDYQVSLIEFSTFQVKYLWLLFDLAVGGDNLVENGPYP